MVKSPISHNTDPGMKAIIAFLVASIIFAVASVAWAVHLQYTEPSLDDGTRISSVPRLQATTAPTATPTTPTSSGGTELPSNIKLTVPYTTQAPFAKWDALHEDACEESSLIMVEHFLAGTQIDSKGAADREIIDLVHWGEARGDGLSITLDQLNAMARDYYHRSNGKVIEIDSVDDIKEELAAGHPVIVGAAGKILPNPNFSNGGPVYHMLVVIGYDGTGFITNDPGTSQGKDFHYAYQDFYNAIHDWDAGNIFNGQKAMLVFK